MYIIIILNSVFQLPGYCVLPLVLSFPFLTSYVSISSVMTLIIMTVGASKKKHYCVLSLLSFVNSAVQSL